MKLDVSKIVLKKCSPECLSEILDLQEEAFEHLEDKKILRRNSKDVLQSCLYDPHYTLGAFLNDKLIAFSIWFDAGETEENIGLDVGLEGEKLNEVINMKLIIVSPQYRGNGLQRIMMNYLENIAKEKNKKIIFTTVSPDNVYSCNNFLALGYNYETTKIKYGGLKRNIYSKKI